MRKNQLPFWLFKLRRALSKAYTKYKIIPQFDGVGTGFELSNPRSLRIFGSNISLGKHVHIFSQPNRPVDLSTWETKGKSGEIHIGNYCLLSPGTQLLCANSIKLGDNCMLAAECYLSDSDWHGIYNRTRPFRCDAPIVLENNVWVGYRAIIQKGVTIGENSIVAAGSVVVNNVPANTIVGGNPAREIKKLSPRRRMLKRDFLFTQETDYDEHQLELMRFVLADNTTLLWLKSCISPTNEN